MIVGLALMAACDRSSDKTPDSAQDSDAPSSAQTGYVSPPEAVAARRTSVGLVVTGRADPEARVRLSSPSGEAYGTTADPGGDWTVTAPRAGEVRLFGLSEVLGERAVQGGGYLALMPEPGRAAVLLRAGGGTEALGAVQGAPQIATIDYDAGGGAVVGGLAKPGASVRLTLDGGVAGETKADAQGRYSITLAGAVKSGGHDVVVQSAAGFDRATFTPTPAAPIAGPPFRGTREASDWRIDWLTPGGAAQTTLVVDPGPEPQKP